MREGLTPILNKLINAYVSKYYIEKGASENANELIDKDQNIFTREYMKKNLFEEVKKEIIGIEKPVIEAQIKKDIEDQKLKEKLSNVKNFIIQTLFIGILLGILTNEITDLLDVTKSNSVTITFFWIIGLSVIIVLLIFLLYINVIEKILRNRES